MENRQQQILAEIQSMMASIRNELNLLDAKISEFQQIADESGSHLEPIDLEPINLLEPDVEFVAEPQVTPSEEPVVEEPVIEEPVVEESVIEKLVIEEPVVEDLPDDDLPFFEEEPVKTGPAPIIDTMTDRQAWRTDMPGGAVKDVRSAISLNDRILFINKLFDEDPMAFQTAIGRINSMESLPEVIDYVHAEHSDWNLESDTVYRFMMAVRRKVR